MSEPWITHGCSTSHGGSVVTCSPFTDISGIGVARKGDMVACPKCKGVYPIVEGDETTIIDGAPVAYQGCKTLCGATLLAKQFAVTFEVGSAVSGGSSGSGGAALTQSIAAAAERAEDGTDLFSGRFRLLDREGNPIAGKRVRLRAANKTILNT